MGGGGEVIAPCFGVSTNRARDRDRVHGACVDEDAAAEAAEADTDTARPVVASSRGGWLGVGVAFGVARGVPRDARAVCPGAL